MLRASFVTFLLPPELRGSLLCLPLEDGEADVGLLGAGGQRAALRLQLLGHGAHVVTLEAAAAADDAHAELVRGPGEPGRLPPGDLPRLHGCRCKLITVMVM